MQEDPEYLETEAKYAQIRAEILGEDGSAAGSDAGSDADADDDDEDDDEDDEDAQGGKPAAAVVVRCGRSRFVGRWCRVGRANAYLMPRRRRACMHAGLWRLGRHHGPDANEPCRAAPNHLPHHHVEREPRGVRP